MEILIAFLLGILTASKPKDPEGSRSQNKTILVPCASSVPNDEQRAEEKKRERRKIIKFWVEIATLFVLVIYATFTIFIWWANRKAADAAKNSADTSAEALHTAERAYVNFPPRPQVINISDTAGHTKVWRFYLPIENSGKTPTKRLKTVFNFDGTKNSEVSTFLDYGKPGYMSLGPQSTLYSESLDVSAETIRKLQAHQTRLFFYGWACYHDQFRGTRAHVTQFCYEVPFFDASKIPGTTDLRIVTNLAKCSSHTCADEECSAIPPHESCTN